MITWQQRYQLPFTDDDGQQHCVCIYYQSDDPSRVLTLVGAEDPFVTNEDDDSDIFTTIRSQSGYIRIIDNDGTLLDAIFPQNNTSRLVRVYAGTWNAGNSTFTPTTMEWVGFVRAESYTQSWGVYNQVLEVPVISVMAALSETTMARSYMSRSSNFASMWSAAMDEIGYEPGNVFVCSDTSTRNNWLQIKVDWSVFFKAVTKENEGVTTSSYIGSSWGEALSSVMQLFGLMCREYHGDIYIMQYDRPENVRAYAFTWSDVQDIANGSTVAGTDYALTPTPVMSSLIFRDANNSISINGGVSSVEVSLSLDSMDLKFSPDPVTQDDSEIYELSLRANQTFAILYCQFHEFPNTGKESAVYYRWTADGYSGETNLLNMIWTSRFDREPTDYDPLGDHYYYVTGAAPVRWFYRTDPTTVKLQDGLFIQHQCKREPVDQTFDDTAPKMCYSLYSQYSFARVRDGYIHISFQSHAINSNEWDYGGIPNQTLYCSLEIGMKCWNGTEWVSRGWSPEEVYFGIPLDGNGNIVTNKTASMDVDANGGWLVPVPPGSGTVIFHILNKWKTWPSFCYSHIITNLEVSFLPTYQASASQRGQNTYYKKILMSGFCGEKSTNLKIGTINNNADNSVFIRDASGNYIETWIYKNGITTDAERPEMHLLGRMESYLKKSRRALECTVSKGVDIMNAYFTFNGRYYFAVSKQRNWREGTERLRLIEITQGNE